jgi:hypothetical protein
MVVDIFLNTIHGRPKQNINQKNFNNLFKINKLQKKKSKIIIRSKIKDCILEKLKNNTINKSIKPIM